MTNYWSTVLNRRVARRRAMAGVAGATAAAAFLAACGGSSDDGSGDGDSSGLVSSAVDTTKQATRTGVLKDRTFGDPPTLDIFTANNPQNAIGPLCYGALTQFNTSLLKPPDNEVIGDLAESWEWSPDGLQVTMKLRQGVKFHNKAPVNGRVFDIEDALFSWNRFATKSSSRASVANSADPNAPVLSLTATDSRTLVMKLKEPLVYALAIFAFNRSGGPVMLPKETDTSLDIRNDLIGTGPFVMANYTPSVAFTLKRHPDYYEKDHALIEQIDLPIVPEYAAALAQFKAGNTYTMGSRSPNLGVKQEEILSVKREEPRILIYEGEMASTGSTMALGYLPGSPFLDERVRQAISMSWDRDLYIDTLNNVTKFAAEGLPVETRWNSHLRATFEGWWLDPKSKDFGPNAKFFTHDIAEAKKLLSAAGFPNGIKDVTSNYVTGPELPTSQQASIIDSMIAEAGILSKPRPIDYAKEYIPQFRDGKGRYEGWAYITAGGGSISGVDAVANLDMQWWSKGGVTFLGFDSSNRGDMSGDPQVDSLIEKARVERDDAKRRALVFDIQRHLGKAWYAMPPSGAAAGFEMAWPCLANFRTNRVGNPPSMRGKWVDETKAPIKNG